MAAANKKLIDPIYKKYASRVIQAVSSTEFYDYFMNVMRAGKNTYQFSNRHVEKSVDERWVIAIESVLKPMEEIINNPRNFIVSEEAIVNVALAKKVTSDSIRHLTQHGDMIDSVTEDSVRPNRLMEKFKEDSWNTYENRFVYTLLGMAWEFVDKRYEAIFEALGEEYGAHLKLNTDAKSYTEHIVANIDLHIRQEEDLLSSDEKNESIFSRIARCHRILGTYRSTTFAKTMAKFGKIKPPLFPTNAIKKNPNFKACHKLWNFIESYHDVGYKIEVFDQSTEISDEFEQDIRHSIMFDYIILKNYLQDKDDRLIDTSRAFKKKALKPKYIREIIEEIVKNYDLPDVEVRKVLIEEITKAQLLKEEESERLRLVEEKEREMKAKKKLEEREARKKAKAEERAKIREEKEKQKALEREERRKEAEQKKQEKLEEQKMVEEAAWIGRIRAELERFAALREENRKRQQKTAGSAEHTDAAKTEAAARKEKEKLQKEKAAQKEKEKLQKEKAAQKEKEKPQKEKAAQKEKERPQKEKTAQKEKEKPQKEKAEQKKEEKPQKEKAAQKEKEKPQKEKAEQKKEEKPQKEKAEQKKEEKLQKEKPAGSGEPQKEKAVPEKDAGAGPGKGASGKLSRTEKKELRPVEAVSAEEESSGAESGATALRKAGTEAGNTAGQEQNLPAEILPQPAPEISPQPAPAAAGSEENEKAPTEAEPVRPSSGAKKTSGLRGLFGRMFQAMH